MGYGRRETGGPHFAKPTLRAREIIECSGMSSRGGRKEGKLVLISTVKVLWTVEYGTLTCL